MNIYCAKCYATREFNHFHDQTWRCKTCRYEVLVLNNPRSKPMNKKVHPRNLIPEAHYQAANDLSRYVDYQSVSTPHYCKGFSGVTYSPLCHIA
jgi:hypothetical protein